LTKNSLGLTCTV